MGSELPPCRRYLTGNTSTGESIFLKTSDVPPQNDLNGMHVSFCFGTTRFPVSFHEGQDLADYNHLIENPPRIVIPNGAAFRMVDFPPGYSSPMHRTISLNFNIVIEGEMEAILDSGETRLLKRGDSVVQRAINHSWRNPSDTQWARIAAFAIPAEQLVVQGKSLEERAL